MMCAQGIEANVRWSMRQILESSDSSNSTNAARREAGESDPVPETALDEGLISDTGAFCFNPPFRF